MECSCACVEGTVSGAASDAGGLGGNIKEAAVLELAQVASAGVLPVPEIAASAGACCQCSSVLTIYELVAIACACCQQKLADSAGACCQCRSLMPVQKLAASAGACCQ